MLALIKLALEALVSWLRIQAVGAGYNLTRKIENDIREDEASIESLRTRADPASQLLADRLRDRIVRAQGIAQSIPTTGAPPDTGADHPGG